MFASIATSTGSTTSPHSESTTSKRTYLAVPYSEKDLARVAGARWSPEARLWYAPPGTNLDALKPWLRVYLRCPFEQKDEVRTLGGRWCPSAGKWFITEDMDRSKFADWLVADVVQQTRVK